MRKLIILIVALCSLQHVNAQQWENVWPLTTTPVGGKSNAEVLAKNVQTILGDYWITGTFNGKLTYDDEFISSNGAGLFVLRVDEEGKLVSLKGTSSGLESLSDIQISIDNYHNLYAAFVMHPQESTEWGYSNTSSDYVGVIAKFDPDLNVIWIKEVMRITTNNHSSGGGFTAIHIGDDGNVYLASKSGVLHADSYLKTKPKLTGKLNIPNQSDIVYCGITENYFKTNALNKDTLIKYNKDHKFDEWLNNLNLLYDNYNEWLNNSQNEFHSTSVKVGDSTYFTLLDYVYVLASIDAATGTVNWSNGITSLMDVKCNKNNNITHLLPLQGTGTTSEIRDLLLFDNRLFIAGSHMGMMISGKKYKSLSEYSDAGFIPYFGNGSGKRGIDLLLISMNAKNGKIEWVQSGGGRGTDQYMRITRKDNFLYVIGNVSPSKNATILNDGTGTTAKDGVMIDSIATMNHNVITSHATRKQSTRMAVNGADGMLYAQYNTEGRLIKKHYLHNASVPVALDLRDSIIAVTSRIEVAENARTIMINAETINIPENHGAMVIGIYDSEANPIETLYYLDDSFTKNGSMRICLDEKGKLFIAGRFRSKSLDIAGHHIENPNFNPNKNINTYSGYLAKAGMAFQPAFTHVEHILCHGKKTGILKVTPFFAKDANACTYHWKNLDDDSFVFNHETPGLKTIDYSAAYELPAGRYMVTVRDGNVERTLYQDIKQPDPIVITPIVEKNNEGCANNGEIEVNVTGGSGSFTYFWTVTQGGDGKLQANEVNTTHISQLRKGNYHLEVRDVKDLQCYKDANYEINGAPVEFDIQTISDFQNKTITLKPVTGGTGDLTYKWLSPSGDMLTASVEPDGTQKLVSLTDVGIYSLIVSDASGCQSVKSIPFSDNSKFYAYVVHKEAVSCNGLADGKMKFVEQNGSNIKRTWMRDGQPIQEPSMQDGTFIGLAAGFYTINFSTNNGDFTITDTIKTPDKLEVTAIVNDISCYGKEDGQIALEVRGGTYPYKYKWTSTNDEGCLNSQNVSQTINNLTANTPVYGDKIVLRKGLYHVDIEDDKGCQTSIDTAVFMPHDITAHVDVIGVSCYGKENGEMKLPYDSIKGGNGGYYHIWSNTLMADSIHGLRANNYGVTVYDKKGCSRKLDYLNVTQPTGITVTGNITPPPCAENPTGKIQAIHSDKYTYKWESTHDLSGINGTSTLDGIPAGIYKLTVTDEKGCDYTGVFDVQALNKAPNISLTLSENVICAGNDIELWAETNGSAAYNYYLGDSLILSNVSDDNIVLSMYKKGDFVMSVTDINENGCKGKASALLTVKYTPSAQIEADSALAWCPAANIKLNLSVADQPNTTMVWTRGNDTLSTDRTLSIDNALGTGKYTLHTVSDGCSSKDSVEVARLDEETMKLEVLPTDPSQGVQLSDTLWCYGLGHIATLSASRHDAFSYLWFRNGDTLILGNGKKLMSPELMTNIPGKYHIQAIFGGCDVTTDTIKIGSRPRIELNLVKDTTIVAGKPYIIDLGENAAIQSYSWTDKDGQNTLSSTHYMEIDTRYAQDGEVRDYKVTVVDTNACSATAQTKIRIQRVATQTTGLTDASVEPLTLYPNPTHSGFYVEAPASDRLLRIYNASGQIVLERPIGGKTWVSPAHLSAGLYLVRTESSAAKLIVE